MTGMNCCGNSEPVRGTEFVLSLCYLYEEAVRQNLAGLAEVLGDAIDKGRECVALEMETEEEMNVLRQHFVLRGFSRLSRRGQDRFLQKLESFGEEV